jgi:formiminotetrahydrofolate cyclodeaminase
MLASAYQPQCTLASQSSGYRPYSLTRPIAHPSTQLHYPLACAKACAEAIELSQEAAEKGSVHVISDAGAGAMSAYAGLKSAALNVYINTASLKDRAFADAQLIELESILSDAEMMYL